MADLNKFIRSKERMIEVLNQLRHKQTKDESTNVYINDLLNSIRVIDHKMEEFQKERVGARG